MSRHQAEVPELRKRHLPSVLTSQDKLAPGPQGGKQGQEKGHDAKRDWVASDDARSGGTMSGTLRSLEPPKMAYSSSLLGLSHAGTLDPESTVESISKQRKTTYIDIRDGCQSPDPGENLPGRGR